MASASNWGCYTPSWHEHPLRLNVNSHRREWTSEQNKLLRRLGVSHLPLDTFVKFHPLKLGLTRPRQVALTRTLATWEGPDPSQVENVFVRASLLGLPTLSLGFH